jgi:cupin fold WbuC family metalloprotein
VEPDSYIPPHRHLDAGKDETILVLRGKFGLVLFKPDGTVAATVLLEAGGEALGVNIPHGQFHSLVALAPGSVFFESKAGPFVPLSAAEKADWAPAEGADGAREYLSKLLELFAPT